MEKGFDISLQSSMMADSPVKYALRQKVEDVQEKYQFLQQQMKQQENKWKKEKAILEQNNQLLNLQIQESKNREVNFKRLNETFLQNLNDFSSNSQNSDKQAKELQAILEKYGGEVFNEKQKQLSVILEFQQKVKLQESLLQEKELEIKDLRNSKDQEIISLNSQVAALTEINKNLTQEKQEIKENNQKTNDIQSYELNLKMQELKQNNDKIKQKYEKKVIQIQQNYEEQVEELKKQYEEEKSFEQMTKRSQYGQKYDEQEQFIVKLKAQLQESKDRFQNELVEIKKKKDEIEENASSISAKYTNIKTKMKNMKLLHEQNVKVLKEKAEKQAKSNEELESQQENMKKLKNNLKKAQEQLTNKTENEKNLKDLLVEKEQKLEQLESVIKGLKQQQQNQQITNSMQFMSQQNPVDTENDGGESVQIAGRNLEGSSSHVEKKNLYNLFQSKQTNLDNFTTASIDKMKPGKIFHKQKSLNRKKYQSTHQNSEILITDSSDRSQDISNDYESQNCSLQEFQKQNNNHFFNQNHSEEDERQQQQEGNYYKGSQNQLFKKNSHFRNSSMNQIDTQTSLEELKKHSMHNNNNRQSQFYDMTQEEKTLTKVNQGSNNNSNINNSSCNGISRGFEQQLQQKILELEIQLEEAHTANHQIGQEKGQIESQFKNVQKQYETLQQETKKEKDKKDESEQALKFEIKYLVDKLLKAKEKIEIKKQQQSECSKSIQNLPTHNNSRNAVSDMVKSQSNIRHSVDFSTFLNNSNIASNGFVNFIEQNKENSSFQSKNYLDLNDLASFSQSQFTQKGGNYNQGIGSANSNNQQQEQKSNVLQELLNNRSVASNNDHIQQQKQYKNVMDKVKQLRSRTPISMRYQSNGPDIKEQHNQFMKSINQF